MPRRENMVLSLEVWERRVSSFVEKEMKTVIVVARMVPEENILAVNQQDDLRADKPI